NSQKDGATAKDDAAKNTDGNAGASDDKSPGEKSPDGKPAEQKSEAPKIDKDQARVTDTGAAPTQVALASEGSAEFIGPVKPRTGHVAAFV
ncbi:hypothetical protein ABTM10_19515, partial [Acinetobacter baumannii]